MFDKNRREGETSRLEVELSEGWLEYRHAVELLDQSDSSRALVLLAKSETVFRTHDDQHGLWRALIGQALLHWREGMAPLAIARALAAMRVAEVADDGYAVGCVGWQIANMMLGQGDYRRAADFLDQAQLALDAVGMAPTGGVLAAAARLCGEIARWQQMCDRQQIGGREAQAAIAEIQRDLMARLTHAAGSMRATPLNVASAGRATTFLMPDPPALLAAPESAVPRAGLGAWLTRLWRRLILSADASTVEGLTRVPIGPVVEDERADEPLVALALGDAPADGRRASAAREAEPAVAEPATPAVVEPALELVPRAASAAPVVAPRGNPAAKRAEAPGRPGLAIYCFGSFRVYYDDAPIDRWESARGRTIFKYLIARRAVAVPKEQLADMFWPESEPELARRSLHQAIYCLRQTFKRVAPDSQVVQFVDDRYRINPDLAIWVDSEEFSRAIEQAQALRAAGQDEQAMRAYGVAVDLYGAPFMAEDRYEDWTEEPRRSFQAMYLEALHWLARYHQERGEHPAAILLCQRALAEESCDEEAHQGLMASYVAQGLRHLAVRQYQICASTLKAELGLAPSEELESFYRRVVAMG